ncbi:conserved domain protein [Actinomyces sp. oral taxon 170 str. F0386]|nr:conserved domain protein [Actinomyces sp. oral taxon 170 str. F0386]
MTMTRPWRRITLQLSQIFLTLGLTFMMFLRRLWEPTCHLYR